MKPISKKNIFSRNEIRVLESRISFTLCHFTKLLARFYREEKDKRKIIEGGMD